MSILKRLLRTKAGSAVAAGILVIATLTFVAPVAHAADSGVSSAYPCSDNEYETRPIVKKIAKEGAFTEPYEVVSNWDGTKQSHLSGGMLVDSGGKHVVLGAENYRATIKLRYSGNYHCVWGLLTLNKKYADGLFNLSTTRPSIWVDLSFDGGKTISLHQSGYATVQSGNSSTYTAGFGTIDPNDPLRHAGANEVYAARVCGHGTHEETGFGGKVKQPRQGPLSRIPKGPAVPVQQREAFESPTVCTPWQVVPR